MSSSVVNKVFDCVYCINLNTRPDRMRKIRRKLRKHKIDFHRVPGIEGGGKENRQIFREIERKNEHLKIAQKPRIKSEFVLGAVRTKLSVLRDAKQKRYKRILILEDDLFFHKHFVELEKRIVDLPPWKILYFGSGQRNWTGIKFGEFYYTPCKSFGMFAVGLDCSLFSELEGIIQRFELPVDNCMHSLQEVFSNESFVLFPNLVIPDVRDSDLRQNRDLQKIASIFRWDLENYDIE